MIQRSCRASPGGSSACRPSCTARSVLVNVPVFSGNADAGRITSARYAGLGQEDVLHDQHLQLGKRLPRVIDVGIGHRRVLAHDVHAADLPACTASMISTTVRPGFGSSVVAPDRFELRARCRVVDALVVGIHHRDQSDVARALDVVLTAQRMQAGARPADLAGHHRQRDQAARVVGAVDMLRDAHAPEDHRRARRRVEARDLADRRRGNAAHRRHRLRAVAGDVLLELLEAAGAVGDEALRDQAFVDDRVHHRVQQRDVGVGLELQVVRGVPRELGSPRIGEDELGPAA